MKKNQNNQKEGNYYLGLDIGTNSIGWAVTDTTYHIPKFKGNAMWGVRLFEEAQSAVDRRGARAARRRLARRKQRLLLLELLFSDEIAKIDPNFFIRLKESSLFAEDKNTSGKYLLFNDKTYTDKDYLKQYPTVYHLRSELIHSKEPHDVRLVFLALHHIMKNRGHFLFDFDTQAEGKPLTDCLDELNAFLFSEFDQTLSLRNPSEYAHILETDGLSITAKKKALRELLEKTDLPEDVAFQPQILSDMLAGATVKLSDLFADDTLKDASVKSVCLKNDMDEIFDELSALLDDRIELLLAAKTVFDAARLTRILDGESYISDAKIKLYHKNHEHLVKLKEYVKTYYPQKYKEIFVLKKDKLNNYAAYSNHKLRSGDYHCDREAFCSYLKTQLPDMKSNPAYQNIYEEIENKTFLSRLTGSDNGVIPCQLHLKELETIVANASVYLPFLNTQDTDGLTIAQKIISIFKFRIPYYVGPLNRQSPHHWVVRTDEKIYPWNFDKVVDKKKSAENFIINLIGRCSYTGEYVLPKDSLLYSEYMLRNELNLLRVNGKELPRDVMEDLYQDLFVAECKTVTVKRIKNYLRSKGLIQATDELGGIDINVKSKLKSYHDFKRLLSNGLDTEDVEAVIQRILIFGDDRKMLRAWLKENFPALSKEDTDYICRLKYQDWGRLSKRFLTATFHIDEEGNAFSIMDMLRSRNVNLSHLLSGEYRFATEAERIRTENTGADQTLNQQIDDLYLSPAVKRSVRQTLKMIDEIVDIQKSAPKKIFIEVARGTRQNLKGKRSVSRKDRLIELYKACGEESNHLFAALCNEEENKLRSDKLYLYYTQFGKCMYSEEPIDLDALLKDNTTYDIDHIFPRSRIKDDSIDNRVLVKSVLNREKTNIYPIDASIRQSRYPFWKSLKEKGLISDKKFQRLVRQTPLSEAELSEFVARQLVETQQSTKAIVSLIKEYYPHTRAVYSKAGNVTDFRHHFNFIKCRDVNDFHHAKDAYLNIVVGNVYDTKFTEQFFRNIARETYSLNKVFEYSTPNAWNADGTSIRTVRRYMSKHNILVTRMPREVKGQLFDLMIMPAGKGQLPVKQGKSIEKYGGYNKLSGAYFMVAEHTKKNKRIRTVEAVMVCDKDFYEQNPLNYCTDRLGLVEPKIIVPKIRFDTLLELNGSKVYITGRSVDQLLCKHAYELVLDHAHEQYIKQILKYLERCTMAKKELVLTVHDGITAEQNIELYDWFVQKLSTSVYIKLFPKLRSQLTSEKMSFNSADTYTQCKILSEILKIFRCDRQLANLSDLHGNKSAGNVYFNKNLSSLQTAYLIHQSPTGLYECKTDLLK